MRNLCKSTVLDIANDTIPQETENPEELQNGELCAEFRTNTVQVPPTLPCGYCDINCIYNAIEMAFIIGVVANILVIARVAKDKRLRDPTFIGIAALAFADLMFLTLNLLLSFETVAVSITCLPPKLLSGRPWYILNSMIWFSANSHVALLAILRYITIAYPIQASVFLTAKRVVMLSAGVWVLGMLLLGTLAALITARIVKPGTSGEFIIIWWITVYLIPLIVTTILHILKMFRLKKTSKDIASTITRRSMSRMSVIVPLVITMATVLPLPKLIFNCMRTAGYDTFPSQKFRMHFQGLSHLIYLVNHFINPFIYGFLSQKFRRSLKDMLSCWFAADKKKNSLASSSVSSKPRTLSSDTMTRNLSSLSSFESIDKFNKFKRQCSVESEDGRAYSNGSFDDSDHVFTPHGTCSLPVIHENENAHDSVFYTTSSADVAVELHPDDNCKL